MVFTCSHNSSRHILLPFIDSVRNDRRIKTKSILGFVSRIQFHPYKFSSVSRCENPAQARGREGRAIIPRRATNYLGDKLKVGRNRQTEFRRWGGSLGNFDPG